ncbi:MAG TPA: hypothetical protein VEZ14_02725 [Dehalococcoidia bacterium]|nr:hypothetical protein [Dehalococcoidia bacterium]
MSPPGSFDDVLDAAIDALRRGEPVSSILAAHPKEADALRPLLQAVAEIESVPPPPEAGERLAAKFSTVRASVRNARASRAGGQRGDGRRAWWQRRLSFASLSVPAGAAAAVLLAGAAAAAAGAISQAPDLPGSIVHVVTFGHAGEGGESPGSSATTTTAGGGTPAHGAATDVATRTGAPGDEASASVAALNRTPGTETGTPAVDTGTPGVTPAATATSSGGLQTATIAAGDPVPTASATPPGPVPGSRTGLISGVHGNTFTLTSSDGDWKVNIDANTVVNGTIVEGATATVTGDITAGKNLHATRVDVTPPGATATPAPGGSAPGPPPGGPPGLTRTPGSRGRRP